MLEQQKKNGANKVVSQRGFFSLYTLYDKSCVVSCEVCQTNSQNLSINNGFCCVFFVCWLFEGCGDFRRNKKKLIRKTRNFVLIIAVEIVLREMKLKQRTKARPSSLRCEFDRVRKEKSVIYANRPTRDDTVSSTCFDTLLVFFPILSFSRFFLSFAIYVHFLRSVNFFFACLSLCVCALLTLLKFMM